MKTRSMCFSSVLGAAGVGALLLSGIFYTTTLNAAQGCGHGYHMMYNGRCVPNNPGPNATAIPGRPDCWRNAYGNVRCYR